MRGGTNPFQRLSIKLQFALLFVLFVSPVVFLNVYGNTKAESILKRQATNAYAELNKQNRALLSRDLDTVNRIASTIIQHSLTQSMSPAADDTERERIDKYEEMDRLLATYSLGVNGGEAVYYYLFMNDPAGRYAFAPRAPLANTAKAGVYFFEREKPAWYDAAVARKGKGALMVIERFGAGYPDRTLAYVRAVNDISGRGGVIGILVATNMDKKLGESLHSVSLTGGDIYLTDWDNRILASSGDAVIGNALALPPAAASPRTAAGTTHAATDDSLYVLTYSYGAQQKLIYRLPLDTLLQQQRALKGLIQLISIAYALVGLVVMSYFWRSLVAPLRKMSQFVRTYEPGKLVPAAPGSGRKDEVGVLMRSLYAMARRLNGLVRDKYQMEIRQKEAQLQILYQQINPHLLYNTLESIYWKSQLEGRTESAEMIKDLSKLMRIGLSRGRELISLREELEHASAYVGLQQRRYEYRFRIAWRIDETLLDVPIPKITLQPLIENAIVHGVRQMEEDGEIVVSARPEGGDAVIRVEDNGFKGADFAAIARLLSGDEGDPALGYGIRNIHDRIRLHYGSGYGLDYAPREGGGTVAAVRIPAAGAGANGQAGAAAPETAAGAENAAHPAEPASPGSTADVSRTKGDYHV